MTNLACSGVAIREQRKKVVPYALGQVLEIGFGSGLNLPYYRPDKVEKIWALEPSRGMRRQAFENVSKTDIPLSWLELPGEEIPLKNNSIDTAIMTYTLCSIPDWHKALQQIRRVLKPDGQLIFCEHGEAPDQHIRRWQNRITPLWKIVGGGCHLNRPVPQYLEEAGFRIIEMEQEYLPDVPRIAGYNYWGIACIDDQNL